MNNIKKHQQSGFSLLELMLSIACCAIITLMSIPALLLILNGGRLNRDTVEMEENNKLLSMTLPNYIGQAIDVDWTLSPITDIGGGRGKLLNFTSSFSTTPEAKPTAIGVFLREAGRPGDTTSYGDIRAVGLYFRNPSTHAPGEFIISSSPKNVGQVTLSSDHYDYRAGSLVGLKISPRGFNAGENEPVRVVQIEMTYRKFLTADKKLWHWCIEGHYDTADCATGASFKDITKTIHISLNNNSVEASDFITNTNIKRKENLYGNLYFFGLSLVK